MTIEAKKILMGRNHDKVILTKFRMTLFDEYNGNKYKERKGKQTHMNVTREVLGRMEVQQQTAHTHTHALRE
jgi:hypothetical protein